MERCFTSVSPIDRFERVDLLSNIFVVLQSCKISPRTFYMYHLAVRPTIRMPKQFDDSFSGIFIALVSSVVFRWMYEAGFLAKGLKCFFVAACGVLSCFFSVLLEESDSSCWIYVYFSLGLTAILFSGYQFFDPSMFKDLKIDTNVIGWILHLSILLVCVARIHPSGSMLRFCVMLQSYLVDHWTSQSPGPVQSIRRWSPFVRRDPSHYSAVPFSDIV